MLKLIQNKIVVGLILLLAVGLSWRLLGCGGPFIPGENDNNNTSQPAQDQGTVKQEPPISASLPKTPLTLNWTKTLQDAKNYHYVMWQNKPMVWFAQDTQGQRREIFIRETATGSQVGLQDRDTYKGKMEDVFVKDNKMYVVGVQNDTRMLQVGEAQDDDTLKWFTVRSFQAGEYDEAKYITFLGFTMLFYGKVNIYSLDPRSTDEPKLFKLPANMFPNVNYMKCSHGYCIALVNNRLPLMFGATTEWTTVPKFITWVTFPTKPGYPFAGETREESETHDKVFAELVKKDDMYLRDRLAVVDKQTAFTLRDHYLFWTCTMGVGDIRYRKSVEKIRALTWAESDLLVVFPKRLVLVHKDAASELPLPPNWQGRNYELHRLTYQGGLLFLEATAPPTTIDAPQSNTRSLYIAPYKPITNFAACQ